MTVDLSYEARMALPSPLGPRCPFCCEPADFCRYWDAPRGEKPSDCLLYDRDPIDEDAPNETR